MICRGALNILQIQENDVRDDLSPSIKYSPLKMRWQCVPEASGSVQTCCLDAIPPIPQKNFCIIHRYIGSQPI